MTKRLRIEVDAPEGIASALQDEQEQSKYLGAALVDRCTVRSVEVIEPERWTELTLRGGPDRGAWVPGVELVAVLPSDMNERADGTDRWHVVSCVEREEYPT